MYASIDVKVKYKFNFGDLFPVQGMNQAHRGLVACSGVKPIPQGGS